MKNFITDGIIIHIPSVLIEITSLQEIRENCFAYCKSLKTIKFPNSFTNLSSNAFLEFAVEEIEFESLNNENFTIIPDNAFYCARSLRIIEIPLLLKASEIKHLQKLI